MTLNSGGLMFVGANAYQINNGTLKSNTATNSDLIVQQWGAGTLTINSVIANGVGASTLTKAGTGTLVLGAANTYTGATFVNAGTVLANNVTGSGTGTGGVTVNGSGTILGGNGTITGSVSVASGATLAPGATGNGTTAILKTGALTLSSGSNFSLDLNGTVAGTSYDQVSVTGAVNITGSNLVLNSLSALSVGDKLFILANDGSDAITGTFAGLAQGASFTSGSDTFTISYIDNFNAGSANDISLTLTAVPEPSTWAAGFLALVAIAYSQRRRLRGLVRASAIA